MYVYSKKSNNKIIHKKQCPYYLHMNHKEIGFFHTLEEAKTAGYHQCKHCSSISKQYRKEYHEIKEYAAENGMAFYLNDGAITIHTTFSKWKIITNGNKHSLFLYHKNTKNIIKQDSRIEGYHSQSVRKNSIVDYMKYITEHDHYRKYNPEYHKAIPSQPRKGTNRYRKQQNKQKYKEHRESVWRVLTLIENNSSVHA